MAKAARDSSWFRTINYLLATTNLFAAGCADFGTGGTGEVVVPPEAFLNVETLDLPAVDEPPVPEDLPTSRPDPFAGQQIIELTVEEARRLALENNLDLRAALLDPTAAGFAVRQEQAAFEALFTADANYGNFDQPTASQLSGSQFESFDLTPGLVQPLQTGGTLRATLPLGRTETDNEFSLLNPSFTSDAALSLTQPLLRGAGTAANALPIRVAFYQQQQTFARTKLTLIRILADVDRAYWRLYAARQELDVRRAEYELAVEQLGRAQRRVDAGADPEVEVLRAQSAVADTLESIIIAENRVRDRQRELLRLMNSGDLDFGTNRTIATATSPIGSRFVADVEELAARAEAGRMELIEAELQIAAETAQVAAARNGVLPVVTLDYRYNVNGLGGDFNDSFRRLGDVDFEDHTVGLNVQVPIGNQAAKSRLRRALINRIGSLLDLDDRRQLIRQEVLNTADALETAWQRIVAARRRVILNARLLEAEIRQFERGLRTSTDVRIVQNRLADARSAEVQAVSEYQIARVDLAFATGTVLGATGVIWEPADPDLGR
jgi:outer membrane protein TolC